MDHSTPSRRQWYRETYLTSEHWRITASAARQRAGFRCEDCGASVALDVHHLTYERIGAELPADLVALCRACHDKRHAIKPKPRRNKPGRKAKQKAKREAHLERQALQRTLAIDRRLGPASEAEEAMEARNKAARAQRKADREALKAAFVPNRSADGHGWHGIPYKGEPM